jgi:hypothetical protein
MIKDDTGHNDGVDRDHFPAYAASPDLESHSSTSCTKSSNGTQGPSSLRQAELLAQSLRMIHIPHTPHHGSNQKPMFP